MGRREDFVSRSLGRGGGVSALGGREDVFLAGGWVAKNWVSSIPRMRRRPVSQRWRSITRSSSVRSGIGSDGVFRLVLPTVEMEDELSEAEDDEAVVEVNVMELREGFGGTMLTT